MADNKDTIRSLGLLSGCGTLTAATDKMKAATEKRKKEREARKGKIPVKK